MQPYFHSWFTEILYLRIMICWQALRTNNLFILITFNTCLNWISPALLLCHILTMSYNSSMNGHNKFQVRLVDLNTSFIIFLYKSPRCKNSYKSPHNEYGMLYTALTHNRHESVAGISINFRILFRNVSEFVFKFR